MLPAEVPQLLGQLYVPIPFYVKGKVHPVGALPVENPKIAAQKNILETVSDWDRLPRTRANSPLER